MAALFQEVTAALLLINTAMLLHFTPSIYNISQAHAADITHLNFCLGFPSPAAIDRLGLHFRRRFMRIMIVRIDTMILIDQMRIISSHMRDASGY